MFRFRVRKNPDPLLKFTQKAVLFQDISIFFVLKTELYLSSGTYFFFWKLVFHFTFDIDPCICADSRSWVTPVIYVLNMSLCKSQVALGGGYILMTHEFLQ